MKRPIRASTREAIIIGLLLLTWKRGELDVGGELPEGNDVSDRDRDLSRVNQQLPPSSFNITRLFKQHATDHRISWCFICQVMTRCHLCVDQYYASACHVSTPFAKHYLQHVIACDFESKKIH